MCPEGEKNMKKLFIAVMVGLITVLFGASSCSEAAVARSGNLSIEYDETSLYIISTKPTLEFNVLERHGDAWLTAHYAQIPGNNQYIKIEFNNRGFGACDVWNSPNGVVFRNIWKKVYGYGFS
jgi:lipoprotein